MNKKLKKLSLILLLGLGTFQSVQSQEFKRDIKLGSFVPKGQWIVGSTVSFSEHNEKNYQFLLMDGFNADGYSFKVSPMFCYDFKDNVAAGGRFAYSRSLSKLDGLTINVDEENQFDVDDMYQLKHSYSAMAVLRIYISLGESKRFALFSELQMQMGGGQSKVLNGAGDALTGTYATSRDVNLGVVPGMVAFINNFRAVEISVGVLGCNFSKVRQTTDQVYQGERNISSANFKINLFSIGLGIAFYL